LIDLELINLKSGFLLNYEKKSRRRTSKAERDKKAGGDQLGTSKESATVASITSECK
jgi:hypothetical protein